MGLTRTGAPKTGGFGPTHDSPASSAARASRNARRTGAGAPRPTKSDAWASSFHFFSGATKLVPLPFLWSLDSWIPWI